MPALVNITSLLFEKGGFFLPYLLLYLLFWFAKWPISTLLQIFVCLHAANVFLFVYFSFRNYKRLTFSDFLFWGALFLLFLIPGAYFEYPSDPWEHFRRIFRWQALGFIDDYPRDFTQKFVYLWGYSLLDWVSVLSRRQALRWYSTFWQFVLAIQVYSFSRRLGFDKCLAYLQVLGVVLLFGQSVFNFRYYALSSTPLAFITYLQCLGILIDALDEKAYRKLLFLPFFVLLLYFNHVQEILSLLICGTVLIGEGLVSRLPARWKKGITVSLLALIILSFVFSYLFHNALALFYSNMDQGEVTSFGSFRIWDLKFYYFRDAIAVTGLFSAMFAILYFRRFSRLSLLTLSPFFVLLFPPTVLLLSQVLPKGYLAYRIFYAMPLSLMFIYGLHTMFRSFGKYLSLFRREPAVLSFVALVLLFSASFKDAPFFGKLFFQLYIPPKERSLEALDQTAEWFVRNRDITRLRNCWITTDDATRTVLSVHFGASEKVFASSRKGTRLDGRLFTKTGSLQNMIHHDGDFCGILVGRSAEIPPTPPSPVAASSHHWKERLGDLHWLITKEFEDAAQGLEALGWRKTFVPPFYDFYEPPVEQVVRTE